MIIVMMKMKIKIDEGKANLYSEYSVDEIYDKIEDIARSANITEKDSDGFYLGNDNDEDFANFGKIIIALNDSQWFIPYIDEWLWYVDNTIEDIAEYYKTRSEAVQNITEKKLHLT